MPNTMQSFEDECFRAWLNRIDATIDYDRRRDLGSVTAWRRYFDAGYSGPEATEDLQLVRDNRAFCDVEIGS